ncbi:MAG: NAD(P)-binding domain-containing protein [Solirubrobacteraceae bacterium]|nr:NAD(P)-binding domain-containing protein [Solirubrobacteraceae bacterium]
MDRPTVCVIGAGISGLTASKSLGDYGIPYETFEISDRVGGNWAFRNPNGMSSAYRSLHIDTSKDLLSFRDLPIPAHLPDFPHHSEIHAYLEQYADTFGLNERIRFRNGVEHARRLDGGGWEVRTQDGETRRFDVLVVGNGHHWDPRYPDFPGTFDGETIHSHHYVDPTEPLDLRGRRLLVVGIGNSAADIVSELSQKSWRNQVTLSTRSGAWIVPKYVFGMPGDRLARTLPGIPLSWQRRLIRKMPILVSGHPESFGLPRPNHEFLEAHPTMSSELLVRLGSGDVVARPDVERLEGDRVRFVDGTVDAFDVVIYATGYNITFPFFDREFLSAPDNRLPLYKRMFRPGIDDLVLVGFAQALPTLFPFIETQSKLMARYVAGTYRPPSDAEMERVIAADEATHVGHYRQSARHTQQVEFFSYERDIHRREIPAGRRRVDEHGPVRLAGRAGRVEADGATTPVGGDGGSPAGGGATADRAMPARTEADAGVR